MKVGQRNPWLILTQIEGACAIMCSFCRYAAWLGGCQEQECECEHPLADKSWNFENEIENAMEGLDCWGFRPAYSREDAADVVGIWLNGQQPDWETVPRIGGRDD